MQTIAELADKVQTVVRTGDALGKTDQEIQNDLRNTVGILPLAVIDAIGEHITEAVARDNAYTGGFDA